MGKANLARDLRRVRAAVVRIDHAALGPDEAQRQLEIQQRAVVRLVDASGQFRGLVDLVWDRGTGVELQAWQRMSRRLEVHHPGLPRVDEISDVQVPDVKSGEVVHISDPRRIGAWTEHAVAVIDVLIQLCDGGDGAAGAQASLSAGEAFGAAAQAMESLATAWKAGDREIRRLMRGGLEPTTGGYEKIVRFDVRAPVDAKLVLLRSTLVPTILPACDPSLRDRVQRFLRLANLDQYVKDQYGDETARWRQSWVATGLQEELDELVPMLRARAEAARPKSRPDGQADTATLQRDARDPQGYVGEPADKSAYVPATEILSEHVPKDLVITSYKQLKSILDDARQRVRQWRPRSNRLSVHLADWVAYCRAPRSGDGWAEAADEDVLSEFRKRKQSLGGKYKGTSGGTSEVGGGSPEKDGLDRLAARVAGGTSGDLRSTRKRGK